MMTTERNKSSVVAKLMGLHNVPPQQQTVYRHQRILSENYLRKSAYITSRVKKSNKARNATKDDSSKDSSRRYIEQRSHSFNGMQGIEERNNLIHVNSPEKIVVLRPNLGNVKHVSKPLFLVDSHTAFGWEFKKQLLERSKRTKICQDFWSNLGETPSIPDVESKKISKLEMRAVISSNEGWKDKSVTKLPIIRRFNISSHPNTKLKKMSKGDLKSRFERHNNNVSVKSEVVDFSCGGPVVKQISEQIACNDSAKEGCFSCSSDVSFEQDSPCEDKFTSLKSIDIDDELRMIEAYQPSPNSVLEPDNSSSSENGDSVSTDLHGLWMKLQILKSESEENQSKPETVTVSDEDATENSFFIGQDTMPIRTFKPKENQEFSYLVNVLNELGFHNGKVVIIFENLHSTEHIIKPLIFETLEKKYEKQDSWIKSDRRLLFDRINICLSEILKPHVLDYFIFSKSLKRKMSTILTRDIVEEELWKLLVSQETKVNASLSEKAVGKEPWLELVDEMDYIVGEIEASLFDELATELVAI